MPVKTNYRPCRSYYNHVIKRQYSSNSISSVNNISNVSSGNISHWSLTGYIDAEGSFVVSVLKSSTTKTGRQVGVRFQVTSHIRDIAIMLDIKAFFEGIGKIVISKDYCTYRVDSLKDITKFIIPHFDKYPLVTQKLADYKLFKDVVAIRNRREHITLKGLIQVLSLKASLNLGLSDELKAAFPDIIPVNRPLVVDMEIPSPEWIAGFTSGDGSFYIIISKDRGYVEFNITQSSRDVSLLEKFISYFGSGRVKKDSRHLVHHFVVRNLQDILEKIIPFYQKYSVLGVKCLDFQDWCKGAELISTQTLDSQLIEKLRVLQGGMNSSRLILKT